MRIHSLAGLFLIIFLAGANAQDDKHVIVQRMLRACDAVKSAKFTLTSTERMRRGNYETSNIIIKLETSPRKIYIYCVNPDAGTEALWVEGMYNNRLFIHPTSFPYVNIKLSPYHSLVRKNTHHTVHALGFNYISEMVRYYLSVHGESFYDDVEIKDTVTWDNRKCLWISFVHDNLSFYDYTVKHGESITSIAQKKNLNDYFLLALNPQIDDYDDVEAGDVIRVPDFYNKRVDFYLELRTWLPLVQIIYDEKGLFEKYELKSFILNPSFDPSEFTPEYEDYKF